MAESSPKDICRQKSGEPNRIVQAEVKADWVNAEIQAIRVPYAPAGAGLV
jgi:hypothetical protein